MTSLTSAVAALLGSSLSDKELAKFLRENLEVVESSVDGFTLIDSWIHALEIARYGRTAPLASAGPEVLSVVVERLGVEAWSEVAHGQSRCRLHLLLDIASRKQELSGMETLLRSLASVIPGSAFNSWSPLSEANTGVSDTFALFEKYIPNPGCFWVQNGWSAKDLNPYQVERGGFPLFLKAVEDGWEPQKALHGYESDEPVPQWQLLLRILRAKDSNPGRRAYEDSLRSWLQEHGLGEALDNSEKERYWSRLKLAVSASDAKKIMASASGWESFRTNDGANPMLVALNRQPNLLDATLSKKASGLLVEQDSFGRDLWYYLLSATTSGLRKSKDGFNHSLTDLLLSYPPRSDQKSRGWLGFLLSEDSDQIRSVAKNGGMTLLRIREELSPSLQSYLQPVLQPGSEEQQHALCSKLLTETNILKPSYSLLLLKRLVMLMDDETYAKVIPELRYLACLNSLTGEDSKLWASSQRLGAVQSSEEELRNLALGGLRFGGVLRNAGEEQPWSGKHPVKEWKVVRGLVGRLTQGYDEALNDLEIGWRSAVLNEGVKPEMDAETEIPRL